LFELDTAPAMSAKGVIKSMDEVMAQSGRQFYPGGHPATMAGYYTTT
jgi:hypothetical protein